MKKLLFIFSLCLVTLVGNATTGQYTAAQVAQLKTDLAAGTYDIYELTESATYAISSSSSTNLTIGGAKTNVTIRAASGLTTKPIVKLTSSYTTNQSLYIFNSTIASLTITFSGIEFDGLNTSNASYQPELFYETGTNNTIYVSNCYIHDFTNSNPNGIMRFDGAGTSLDVQNCTIDKCSGRGFLFQTTPAAYGSVNFKNNTFSNTGTVGSSSSIVYCRTSSGNKATNTNVSIDHCTFFTAPATTQILVFQQITGNLSITNCIFDAMGTGSTFSTSVTGSTTINKCYLAGFTTPPTGGTNTFSASTAPSYDGAATLNFGLSNKSSFIGSDALYAGNTSTYLLAPTTSAASGFSSTGLSANWSAVSNASSGYDVYLYKSSDNSLVTGSPFAASGQSTTTKAITGLSVNTSYYYKVAAKGNLTNYSNSDPSTSSSNYYTLADVTSAPTLNNPTSISLDVAINSSTNPSTTQFAIYETSTSQYVQTNGSLGASAFWQTASTWGTKTVTGLAPSTSYTFEVKARNGDNTETAYGSTASLSTASNGVSKLTTPTANAAGTITTTGFTASWAAITGATGGYSVKVYSGASLVSTTAVSGQSTTSQAITGLTYNTAYTYTVTAICSDHNTNLDSDPSNAPGFTTNNLTQLDIPTNVSASAITLTGFTANWTAVSNALSYDIKVYNSVPALVSTTNASGQSTSSKAITGLTTGTAYTYTVTAIGDGVSSYSNSAASSSASITTNAGLTAPTVGVATTYTATGFTANWTAVANAVSYDVKLYQGATLISTTNFTGQATASGALTGLTAGLSYTYTVTAKGDAIIYSDSPASSASAAYTSGTPSVAAYDIRSTGFTAGWSITSSATNYVVKLYQGGDLVSTTSAIALNGTGSTASPSYIFTGLILGLPYTYTVTTSDGFTSAESSVITTVNPTILENFGDWTAVSSAAAINFSKTLNDGSTGIFSSASIIVTPGQSVGTAGAAMGNARPSAGRIQFSATGNYLQLPQLQNVSNLTVKSYNGPFNLQSSTDGNTWSSIAGTTTTNNVIVVMAYNFNLGYSSSKYIRLVSTSGSNVYFYDLQVNPYISASKLASPTVGAASSIIAAGFTANWSTVTSATGYVVKLYQGSNLVNMYSVSGQTANSLSINGLNYSTTYTYKVIAVGDLTNYASSDASSSVEVSTTALIYGNEPTLQASNVSISNINTAGTGFTINWTGGNGAKSIVVVKAASAVNSDPVDYNTYSGASGVFGSGSQLGTGNYVVYTGTGTSVAITGLTKGTRYYINIYTYNTGSGNDSNGSGTENYLTSSSASSNQLAVGTIISNGTNTASTGVSWATAAWVGGVAPGANDNVIIVNGDNITVASSPSCYNLTINSGGKLFLEADINNGLYVTINGTSLVCNGTFGDKMSDGITDSGTGIRFTGDLTITGSGGKVRPHKISPAAGANNASVTFDTNTEVTYTGSGIISDYSSSDNITYTVNTGKIVNLLGNLSPTSSSITNGSANTTFKIYGTLNVLRFYTPVTSGKTCTINIYPAGTLSISTTFSPFSYSGGSSTNASGASAIYNINGSLTTSNCNFTPSTAGVAPTINVGSSGSITVSGTADFSSTTVSGYIGNTPSTTGGTFTLASGGTISLSNANGLNPTDGPIRTSTRSFNTAAKYSYVGSVAQVTGSDLPATVNTLTIGNAAGVTLSSNVTTTTLTNNASSILNVPAAKQLTVNTTLANNGTINLLSDASGTATILTPTIITGSGTATVQQYLSSSRNWYMSSPVSGATGLPTVDSGSLIFYSYPENDANQSASGAYWNTVSSGTMAVGTGYIVKPSVASTITFSGTSLNTGDKTISGLTNSTTNNPLKHGFNLIGNPYPSYLNVLPALNGNSNLETTVWYRTRDTNTTPLYHFETVNATTGVGTNASGTGRVSGYIPPMQAFWARTDLDNQSITLLNSNRSHSKNDVSMTDFPNTPTTSLKTPSTKQSSYSLLGLNISNGSYGDETIVMFDPAASNGLDAYDSGKMSNSNINIPELFTVVGGSQLAINGMNNIPYDTEIPLGFTTGLAGTFTIKASQINNFDSSTSIYLKDNDDLLNTPVQLNSDAVYSFSSAVTTNNTSRFALIFKAPSIATSLNPMDNSNVWISTNANNQIVVNGGNSVEVYNAVGQKLAVKNLTTTTTVLETPLQSGVYFVAVGNGAKSLTRKVIIK